VAHPRTLSQYSETNYCCCQSKWNLIVELGEITDSGNDAQFMVFVGYRATEEYVKQFLFCRRLPNIPQESTILRKWISLLRNISFRGLIACLFAPMVVRPWWEPKRFYEYMKKENENIKMVIVFFTEKKSGGERNLRKADISFKIYFICCPSHQMPSLTLS